MVNGESRMRLNKQEAIKINREIQKIYDQYEKTFQEEVPSAGGFPFPIEAVMEAIETKKPLPTDMEHAL